MPSANGITDKGSEMVNYGLRGAIKSRPYMILLYVVSSFIPSIDTKYLVAYGRLDKK